MCRPQRIATLVGADHSVVTASSANTSISTTSISPPDAAFLLKELTRFELDTG
jgi:hypothetical protein